MVTRKSKAEIERMRRAGRVVAEVLALMEERIRPGASTAELDRVAEAHIRASGATPTRQAVVDGAMGRSGGKVLANRASVSPPQKGRARTWYENKRAELTSS
jgi:Xaa-Pro aminopeptidase